MRIPMVPPRSAPANPRRRHIRFPTVAHRPAVFATDLDRTLLRPGGAPTRAARTAIRAARALGLRTLLVSGRPHGELVRFADAFGGFDGLVAENGAVVEAPIGSRPLIAGARTAARVRRGLEGRSGLHCEFGEIVVSVPRRERRQLVRVVGSLPVRLVSNVDRVMVLPRGVSKWSGTRAAMRQLRLPGLRYAAIGDGENDLDLLRGSSLSGAVANATSQVRAIADYVSHAPFDRGVLEFVQRPLTVCLGGLAPHARSPARGAGLL
jgi:hydroxymethylpyrimidine pyrophosphatase-like HAD family hydrolase